MVRVREKMDREQRMRVLLRFAGVVRQFAVDLSSEELTPNQELEESTAFYLALEEEPEFAAALRDPVFLQEWSQLVGEIYGALVRQTRAAELLLAECNRLGRNLTETEMITILKPLEMKETQLRATVRRYFPSKN